MTDPACYRVGLEHYPGMNRFVLDWLRGDERFLKRSDAHKDGRKPVPTFLANAIGESNRRWGLKNQDEIERWAKGDTFTVVAGQQVGFAGGPLYTIAKLASLLKMKRDNEASGIPTTAFFWLATEDHDFDEVATIALQNEDPQKQQDLVSLKAPRLHQSKQPVGSQPVPESLIASFLKTMAIERPSWLRPNITFADSFAELVREAVDAKFILIDSLLPELRRAGVPIVQQILDRWHDIQHEIEARSEELQKAGYTPQVIPRPGEAYTLLFRIDEKGDRDIIHRPDEAGPPGQLSTSALTRPLLQDFVLRPDVFVGGPAEVAYYAQIAPLHKMLDVPMPRVALRAHLLAASRATLRRFAKYAINPEEVFTSPEALVATREPRGVAEVRSIASEAERQLEEHIEKIRELALPADHAVARSINRSIGHISYHFRKLTERAIRGLVRKDRDRFDAAKHLVSTFFPDGHVQDRILAWVPFWIRQGAPFVERLISEAEPDTATFKIVGV